MRFARGRSCSSIDSRDVKARSCRPKGALAQARAAEALAQTNFQRFEQLFARGAASQLELDQARYQYDTAKGAVTQAEGAVATASSYQLRGDPRALRRARRRSPLRGGGHGRAGAAADEDRGWPEPAPRRLAARKAPRGRGARTGRAGPGPGRRRPRSWTARSAEVVPAVDPATRSFLVKIDLPGDSGASRRALRPRPLPDAARGVLRVPRAACDVAADSPASSSPRAAARSSASSASRRRGAERPRSSPVSRDGDRIVLDPPAALEVGAPIEVQG